MPLLKSKPEPAKAAGAVEEGRTLFPAQHYAGIAGV
jgi:hypothetical protein